MKKNIAIILLCFTVMFLTAGCETQNATQEEESPMMQIGNPWSEWNSVEEAESATGFSFGLPEAVAGYTAAEFLTMNNELLEIIYKNHEENSEVCIRKQKGEEQDISGDYNEYEICEKENRLGGAVVVYSSANSNSVKIIISYQGYSWSIVALDGFYGDSAREFISAVCS